MTLIWILLFSFFSLGAPMMPFFGSPQSLFPSGEASLDTLFARKIGVSSQLSVHAYWGKQDAWVPIKNTILSLETSNKVYGTGEAYSKPQHQMDPLYSLDENEALTLLETDGFWAKVLHDKKIIWTPLLTLKPEDEDLGVIFTKEKTQMHLDANNKSEVLYSIPPQMRLKPLQFDHDWVQISYKNSRGYIPIHKTVSRLDFAYKISLDGEKWNEVIEKAPGKVKIEDPKRWIHFEDIKKIKTYLLWGLNLKHKESPLSFGQTFLIREHSLEYWANSVLSGHGSVWWKVIPDSLKQKKTLTSEEILKRSVFSYATQGSFHLVSADGIFKSIDGGHEWEKIPRFGEENHPVAITQDATFFVGPYVSRNKGKTFSGFIDWGPLTSYLKTLLLRPPMYIRLNQLEVGQTSKSDMVLSVDTGYRVLKIRTSIPTRSFTVVR